MTTTPPPLLVTADDALLDELLRLSAAAGTTPDVARDVSDALRSWAKAPLVLVGADLAEPLARAAPARRDAVFVVLVGQSPHTVFATALAAAPAPPSWRAPWGRWPAAGGPPSSWISTRWVPVSTGSSASTWSTASGGTRWATPRGGSARGRCVTRCPAATAAPP